ncbi:protein polybromo-1-like isoform X2 [Oppia nitens]|uniref:protein polybromo-1-like isoform X2 n=1 Tax=Oppia nitens TaxID=1686743 RepID=UPI0023DC850C|nr:protein polybromo-1-like isoform X2 [Oppia nitens]
MSKRKKSSIDELAAGDGNGRSGDVRSERIRAKRMLSGGLMSAAVAALKYETDSDMDASVQSTNTSNYGDETTNDDVTTFSDPEDAENNPQWQLFEAICNHSTPAGTALSDPFMRLPSRRFYPDYYQEIKRPMSLAKIRAKIKTGAYNNVTNLVEDLSLTFENAMKYNRPDSKIFKDAMKLKKVLQVKAQEILNITIKDTLSDDSDSDDDNSKSGFGVKRLKKQSSNPLTHELKKARRSQMDIDAQLKKRMKALYKALCDYNDDSGRSLIQMFMEKPSKKIYPDYYEVITNPIDMKTIESNIKWERYPNEEVLINDFKLMFSNCKQYNEDNSQIYKDSVTLESLLMDKLRELGPFEPKSKKTKDKASINLIKQKLITLYNTVKDYNDAKGRQLSTLFMKLPLKTEMPEYYEIIKKPVGLEKIGVRLKNNIYETLEDLLSDIILMLDNACKYNEPDSQIYKDALTLQQVALQTKIDLTEDNGTGIPDVKAIIQELLTNLFISVYNHQDEEGRCYSDSIIELSETDQKTTDLSFTESLPSLNLDTIKRNLDKGKYRRLDRFQKDMFEVFERARRVSRTDSQAFEDSVELQTYFIYLRNELCRHGKTLESLALKYSAETLFADVDALKQEKIRTEQTLDDSKESEKELEESILSVLPTDGDSSVENEMTVKDMAIKVGDFVYIEPREKNLEPHIIYIEKFNKDENGEHWIYGRWFFRPYETFHIASKKFLEKEVFKSDSFNSTPLSQVVGKCCVMFVKDYFRCKPQEFDDKDIYVCESRYFTRTKTFKKIKVWPFLQNLMMTPRETPLPMIRVPSVFKDQTDKIKIEVEEEPEEVGAVKVLDIDRPNVLCDLPEGASADDGYTYYEQFTIPSGTYKLGDCSYVRTDTGRNLICRIDRIWVDKEGNAYFHGPWFVQQPELPPLIFKSFYEQEVFLSSIEDTNPLLSICERCAVVEYKDFIARRPTEIPEKDIYVCESRYLEHEKKFQKLIKGLPTFAGNRPGVAEDEIYYFRKPLVLQKTTENGAPVSPAVSRKSLPVDNLTATIERVSADTEGEETNDTTITTIVEPTVPTPGPTVIRKRLPKRLVTGYIVFASEVRKSVVQANPECSFGDVSRIIGTEWKNLPLPQKAEYEQKAQRQNEETAREVAAANAAAALANDMPNSPASTPSGIENAVYECRWESKCDFQFEESSDLLEHLISEPNGHVWQSFGANKDKEGMEFQCLFQGCGRVKKGMPPFPNFQRLIRHCKEIHVTKQTPKSIAPENRNKNCIQSRKSMAANQLVNNQVSATNNITIVPQTAPQLNSTGVQVKPIEPVFVGTPPRANRLLHTHTYMKYIEKLSAEGKEGRHISNWETQLNASPETIPQQDINRLPTHWLANGAGNHGNVVNALWALRNFMFKDALNLNVTNNN